MNEAATRERPTSRVRASNFALVTGVLYFLLLGGTDLGAIAPPLMVANAALGALALVLWIRRLPRDGDRLDHAALVAALLFALSGVFSAFPRQSLEAATAGLAYAATFYLARRYLARTVVRAFMFNMLGFAGVILSVGLAVSWIAVWMSWLAIADFGPPLNMPLPVGPYRHPHVAAMLVALLLPAIWGLGSRRSTLPFALTGALGAAFVVIASGSRTVWAAAVIATLVSVLIARHRGKALHQVRSPTAFVIGGTVLTLSLVALMATGIGQALVSRLATVTTLGARGRIWSATVDAFLDAPITGWGSGSFAIALPLSGYYDTAGFAPRHADNAVLQLLAETGSLGFIGVAMLAIVVLIMALRHTPKQLPALWGVVFFGFCCVTNNPSDTPALSLLVVLWAAAAIPPGSTPLSGVPARRRSMLGTMHLGAFTLIAMTYVGIFGALFAYQDAGAHLERDQPERALASLNAAVWLDPGMSPYFRYRGLVKLHLAMPDDALDDLHHAHHLSQGDDIAARGLSLAYHELGRTKAAAAWAGTAVEIRQSAPVNHLTLAYVLRGSTQQGVVEGSLTRALSIDPRLTAAPSWKETFGTTVDARAVTESAAGRVRDAQETAAHSIMSPAWLSASAGQTDTGWQEAQRVEDARRSLAALVSLLDCDLEAAAAKLLAAQEAIEWDSAVFWIVRIMVERAAEADADTAIRLAGLLSPRTEIAARYRLSGTPMLFHAVQDRVYYRRIPLPRQIAGPALPTAGEGSSQWLRDPRGTAVTAAPASGLARCSRSNR